MDALSNIQISRTMRRFSQFLGVFPSKINPIHFISSFPCCFIMNSLSQSHGGHWLAFYLISPHHLEFFDSLGNRLNSYIEISHYFSKISHIISNKFILQTTMSTLCGDFAISFLSLRMSGFSYSYIIHIFKNYSKGISRNTFVRRIRLLLK